ncbi:hypothetical protein KCQ_22010 [Pectobacterium atrosepticum ICMP 1526]|nr:hypothetical protein KCQ_22010 [Pectobacterium atrosepticum ICMP 1526]
MWRGQNEERRIFIRRLVFVMLIFTALVFISE